MLLSYILFSGGVNLHGFVLVGYPSGSRVGECGSVLVREGLLFGGLLRHSFWVVGGRWREKAEDEKLK